MDPEGVQYQSHKHMFIHVHTHAHLPLLPTLAVCYICSELSRAPVGLLMSLQAGVPRIPSFKQLRSLQLFSTSLPHPPPPFNSAARKRRGWEAVAVAAATTAPALMEASHSLPPFSCCWIGGVELRAVGFRAKRRDCRRHASELVKLTAYGELQQTSLASKITVEGSSHSHTTSMSRVRWAFFTAHMLYCQRERGCTLGSVIPHPPMEAPSSFTLL